MKILNILVIIMISLLTFGCMGTGMLSVEIEEEKDIPVVEVGDENPILDEDPVIEDPSGDSEIESRVLDLGETVMIAGHEYTFVGVNTDSNSAILEVDGMKQSVLEGKNYDFEVSSVLVKSLYITTIPTTAASIEIFIQNYGGQGDFVLDLGESMNIAGNIYEFVGANADSNTAIFKVNGETKTVEARNSYMYNVSEVAIRTLYITTIPTTAASISFDVKPLLGRYELEMEDDVDLNGVTYEFIGVDTYSNTALIKVDGDYHTLRKGMEYSFRSSDVVVEDLLMMTAPKNNAILILDIDQKTKYNRHTLDLGSTKIIDGVEYTLLGANPDANTAILKVGNQQKTVDEDREYDFSGSYVEVEVDELFITSIPTTSASITIRVFSELDSTLTLELGEMKTVSGTPYYLVSGVSGTGVLSLMVGDEIKKVSKLEEYEFLISDVFVVDSGMITIPEPYAFLSIDEDVLTSYEDGALSLEDDDVYTRTRIDLGESMVVNGKEYFLAGVNAAEGNAILKIGNHMKTVEEGDIYTIGGADVMISSLITSTIPTHSGTVEVLTFASEDIAIACDDDYCPMEQYDVVDVIEGYTINLKGHEYTVESIIGNEINVDVDGFKKAIAVSAFYDFDGVMIYARSVNGYDGRAQLVVFYDRLMFQDCRANGMPSCIGAEI